ncbi:methionyl-tRNA formyltransferase [Kordiimonas lacus]|uniref:UDP-4-amino-4-deoxy-L-arabinose formyltransferase / UDP-glucuronic acid dehydrogenase (UDP-4-keto-hexauronic acid decarboxylating) n=1 Tax=Kordiimonas lacus TaxID=637679 RepID=A0A1G6TBJ7_9PROT|nr:formyltransferase family protein [Kordiimonas lacus]SDD26234.1 UDP-4-amino-4-deoxy-L-arabinose formyltransferase / UDP-glucuronic acid dehydrogenase (UDP-4-keto-hexauronic acid decarboxylating) [Kordiimonas lacus]
MKVCLFGCKSTTELLARHILETLPLNTVVTISADKAKRAQVADFSDLAPWCSSNGVRLRYSKRYDQKSEEDLTFFQQEKFDIGFVNGWQRLVPEDVLATFRIGVFGMHGSAANLPIGRGRSPMNWSLIEGRKVFYTNLFKYKAGVDDGDVVDCIAFGINDADTAETLHYKNTLAMAAIIKRNLVHFAASEVPYQPQDGNLDATYYPKRTPDDSLIDWTGPIDTTERFIRAVAPPFNGAFTFHDNIRISVLRAAIFELDNGGFGFESAKCGQIVEVFGNKKFLIKVPGGLLIVHDYYADGFTPQPGMVLTNGPMTLKAFPCNSHGGHDLPND